MSNKKSERSAAIAPPLSGKGSHVEVHKAVEAMDWKLAGNCPGGLLHSAYQLVNHIAFWQDWAVEWMEGGKPGIPRHASGSWPGEPAPSSEREWKQAVARLKSGLDRLEQIAATQDLLAKRGRRTPLAMLQTIALHNSYHVGQLVLLRQLTGAWPPPGGGLTW